MEFTLWWTDKQQHSKRGSGRACQPVINAVDKVKPGQVGGNAEGGRLCRFNQAVMQVAQGRESARWLPEGCGVCRQGPPGKGSALEEHLPPCAISHIKPSRILQSPAQVTVRSSFFTVNKVGSHRRITSLEWHDVLWYFKSSLCC